MISLGMHLIPMNFGAFCSVKEIIAVDDFRCKIGIHSCHIIQLLSPVYWWEFVDSIGNLDIGMQTFNGNTVKIFMNSRNVSVHINNQISTFQLFDNSFYFLLYIISLRINLVVSNFRGGGSDTRFTQTYPLAKV